MLHTENDGHARMLASNMKDTDVIVVAGGDGTLSEASKTEINHNFGL